MTETKREVLVERERANLIRAITHGHVDVADWKAYDAVVEAERFNEEVREPNPPALSVAVAREADERQELLSAFAAYYLNSRDENNLPTVALPRYAEAVRNTEAARWERHIEIARSLGELPPAVIEEERQRLLNDAQNYPGFGSLVDAFEAAVREDERRRYRHALVTTREVADA